MLRPKLASVLIGLLFGWSVWGEVLYNGIELPDEWPPRNMEPNSYEPMPVPYLGNIPAVIPIDIGRQLFVDDFLIEETNLKKQYHLAKKYENNPILRPQTESECNIKGNSVATPKSGGVWWDPKLKKIRMWYEAGWLSNIAYAQSDDGLKWQRPELDVMPGTNIVLDPNIIPDSWSVVPDYENPGREWVMYLRSPGGSHSINSIGMSSSDGIHWSKPVPNGPTGDRSTIFYNPFRKKWVFSLRSGDRKRSRRYWERDDFIEGQMWDDFKFEGRNTPVFWAGADKLDMPDPNIGDRTQLYNLDAVAYESIMLGFYQIHRGPDNKVCMKSGIPKITELNLAYSRDGFHWDRPDRRTFISASRREGVWDRGYVQSVGGLCLVQGDKLWFYYIGFEGTPGKYHKDIRYNGMYDRGSTGIAFLRRDGFVSLDANKQQGYLITRPVTFKGKYLFVNVNNPNGTLQVEVLDENDNVIVPFTKENCIAVGTDKTLQQIKWQKAKDLASLGGKNVKFKFYLTDGSLYSFWVSPDKNGASNGYVAAGGIGFDSYKDTKGIESYKVFNKR